MVTQNDKIKTGSLIALIFFLLITVASAAQGPRLTTITMTSNAQPISFYTGNVQMGTYFPHTTTGYYGQSAWFHVSGNESGACTTFNNLTLNVTLTYENIPFVYQTGARDSVGMCLNSSIDTAFGGVLGGGATFKEPRFSTSDLPALSTCNYNQLDQFNNIDPHTNQTAGTYCNSNGFANTLPDGSIIMNVVLWNFNSGQVYDNDTYYFIEGCELGCALTPTVVNYVNNSYFNSNVGGWTNTSPVWTWQWRQNTTDALFRTAYGVGYLASYRPSIATSFVYSDHFFVNRTDFSLLLQAKDQTYSDGAGALISSDLVNLATAAKANIFSVTSVSGASNWQVNGTRYSPASLLADGLGYDYRLRLYTQTVSALSTYAEISADYVKAIQYAPNLIYNLTTNASSYSTGLGLNTVQGHYDFYQCSEYQTPYVCQMNLYQNGTLVQTGNGALQNCNFQQHTTGDWWFTGLAPGVYTVTSTCTDATAYPTLGVVYTGSANITVGAPTGTTGNVTVAFTNPTPDGVSLNQTVDYYHPFRPTINSTGCISACNGSCGYTLTVDGTANPNWDTLHGSSGTFTQNGVVNLTQINGWTQGLQIFYPIKSTGDHTLTVSLGCPPVCTTDPFVNVTTCTTPPIGSIGNPLLASAFVNFRTGNVSSVYTTLNEQNLTYLPNTTSFGTGNLVVTPFTNSYQLCNSSAITMWDVLVDGAPITVGYDEPNTNVWRQQPSNSYIFPMGTHLLQAIGRCGSWTSTASTSKFLYFTVAGSGAGALSTAWISPTPNETINTTTFEGVFSANGCTTSCSSGSCNYGVYINSLIAKSGTVTDGNWSVSLTTPIGIGNKILQIGLNCPENAAINAYAYSLIWTNLTGQEIPVVPSNIHLQVGVEGGTLDTTNRRFFLDSSDAFDIEPKWWNLNRKTILRATTDLSGTCQVVREDVRLFREKPMALAKLKKIVQQSVLDYETQLSGLNCTTDIYGACYNVNGTQIITPQTSVWTKLVAFFKSVFSMTPGDSPAVQYVNATTPLLGTSGGYQVGNTTYFFDPSTPFVTNEVIFSLDSTALYDAVSSRTVQAQTINCDGLNVTFVGTGMDKLLHPAYNLCIRQDYDQQRWGDTILATINLPAGKWTNWPIDNNLFTRDIEAKLRANQFEMSEQGLDKVKLDESDFETHIYARLDCMFSQIEESQQFHFLVTTRNYTPRPIFSLGMLFVLAWMTPVILTVILILQNARGGQGGQGG